MEFAQSSRKSNTEGRCSNVSGQNLTCQIITEAAVSLCGVGLNTFSPDSHLRLNEAHVGSKVAEVCKRFVITINKVHYIFT